MKLSNYLSNPRIQVFILLFLFIIAYLVPIKAMVSIWWHNEDYSYGFLIPLVSIYLFWDKRSLFKDITISSSWAVLPFLLLFVLFSLYGILGSSGSASMPSVPVLIILFAALCFGISAVRQFILPLAFLLFMVPIPSVLENTISVYLKTISTKLGGLVIQLFDIPVHVSGNVIDLGVEQLQVVDACNGLRYIFALLALGVLSAYLFEKVTWKRIIIALSTIPISIVANALRIGATGVLSNYYGPSVAKGFFHNFAAATLFALSCTLLFLLGLILRKLPPKGPPATKSDRINAKDPSIGSKANIYPAFYTSVCILIAVAMLSWSTSALPPVKIRGGIQSFPLTIGAWQGQIEYIDPVIIEQSGAEEAYSALYRNPDMGEISLYMGYRSSAFLSNENFFHSPTVCLPSSGWTSTNLPEHIISDVPRFGQLKVSRMMIEMMGSRQLVYFWFQTKDKATADKSINRFHLAWHAITRDNTHDFFIRPITRIKDGETLADAEKRMDQFVREMMTLLFQFLQERQYEARGNPVS